MAEYPFVRMGNFLRERKEFITIDDFEMYKRAKVQWYGKGIILRDRIPGIEIKTKKQQVIRAGEFVVAEIDAKDGSFGVTPDELDEAIVSSHYFVYEVDESLCLGSYLEWYVRTNNLQALVKAQGSTNYSAIRSYTVFDYEIPLPLLTEQRRIVAHIESLAAQVKEAQRLREEAANEAEVLMKSSLQKIFLELQGKFEQIPVEDISKIVRGRGPEYQGGSKKIAINQKCVKWSGIELAFAKEVSSEWYSTLAEHHFLQEGDIVVNSTGEGTIGRSCLVTANAAGLPFDSHVLAIKNLKNSIISKFIVYFLMSPIGQGFINNAKGAKTTKQTELGSEKLGKIKLPIPPLDEQRRIVAYLDSIQARLASLRQLQSATGEELSALLPSVLDRAFKGEL